MKYLWALEPLGALWGFFYIVHCYDIKFLEDWYAFPLLISFLFILMGTLAHAVHRIVEG